MNTRTRKRRIYARFGLQEMKFWRSPEDRAWLDMVPIGREFGSKDYERLEVLDAYTEGRLTEEVAIKLLKIDRAALVAMVAKDGLEKA